MTHFRDTTLSIAEASIPFFLPPNCPPGVCLSSFLLFSRALGRNHLIKASSFGREMKQSTPLRTAWAAWAAFVCGFETILSLASRPPRLRFALCQLVVFRAFWGNEFHVTQLSPLGKGRCEWIAVQRCQWYARRVCVCVWRWRKSLGGKCKWRRSQASNFVRKWMLLKVGMA